MVLRPFRTLATAAVGAVLLALCAPAAASAEEVAVAPAVGRVAAVYALTVPASSTSLISSDDLALYTAPDGILTRELAEVIDTPVAIGIDPMILASIRVLGTAAPATAVEWLDQLSSATNETFPLAYADADLTLALQAGSPLVLAPTSFDFAVDPARFATPTTPTATPTATPGSTPASTVTPTAEPTEPAPTGPPALPTTESLLAWDYTLADVAWPAAGTVVATDLAALTASGYSSAILGSGNVQRVGQNASVTVGGVPALVTDDGLSAALTRTVTASSVDAWEPELTQLQASLDGVAAAGGAEGATIVMAIQRGTLAETSRVASTMAAIDSLASVDTVALSAIGGTDPVDAQLIDSPQTPERISAAQALLAAEASDGTFATVAENPLLITGDRRLRLLTVLSSAWAALPGGFTTVSGAYFAESIELHQSVRVVKSSEINLVADRASLPVTVSNSLNQPVTVNVSVTTGSAVLAVEEETVTLTMEPDSQRRAQIPVQSLSNGTAIIAVSIASPTGVPIGTPSTVRINVYAGWETPITVAIGIVVFLIFGFGIARTILRRRKSRQESAE
jgi:hypothetical protein